MGEFVRSASSTVEAPVVRKLIEMYPDAKPVEEKKPVKKAAAKKAAVKPKGEVSAEQAAELAAELGVDIEALKLEQAKSIANKEEAAKHEAADRAAENAAPAAPATPAPRPGNNPFSTGGVVPRPPRPGNNPFSTGGAVPRPPQRPAGTGAPRLGMAGSRPGSVRPGFAARPGARVLHQVVQQQVEDFHHARVVHHRLLHINQIHQVQVHQQVVHNVQVVVVHHNAVAQVEHSERMQVRNQVVNKSLVRHYAMSSTICRHHNLVAQLFLTVMARRLFVCVAALHWQILQTRLVQIQQR